MYVVMLDSVATAHAILKEKFIYDLDEKLAEKLIARKKAKAVNHEIDKPMVKRRVTSLPHGDKG